MPLLFLFHICDFLEFLMSVVAHQISVAAAQGNLVGKQVQFGVEFVSYLADLFRPGFYLFVGLSHSL